MGGIYTPTLRKNNLPNTLWLGSNWQLNLSIFDNHSFTFVNGELRFLFLKSLAHREHCKSLLHALPQSLFCKRPMLCYESCMTSKINEERFSTSAHYSNFLILLLRISPGFCLGLWCEKLSAQRGNSNRRKIVMQHPPTLAIWPNYREHREWWVVSCSQGFINSFLVNSTGWWDIKQLLRSLPTYKLHE